MSDASPGLFCSAVWGAVKRMAFAWWFANPVRRVVPTTGDLQEARHRGKKAMLTWIRDKEAFLELMTGKHAKRRRKVLAEKYNSPSFTLEKSQIP